MMHNERRRRRSSDPSEALELQLTACLKRANLTAMVLADEQGLCVSSAGHPAACEELAAQLVVLTKMVGPERREIAAALPVAGEMWNVHLRRFEVYGTALYMCAAGGASGDRQLQLSRSVNGIARILS